MDFLMLNAHRYVTGYLPGSNLGMNILLQLARKRGYCAEMLQDYVNVITAELNRRKQTGDIPKIIGFYTDFNNIRWTEKIIRRIKAEMPGTVVIVGGPQAAGLGEAFLRETGADVICPGEGEESLMELLDFFLRGIGTLSEIQGVGFLDNDHYYSTPQRIAPKSLDQIPWPDLSLTKDYSKFLMPILTGRGCPMGCTFCYEGANARNIRTASVSSVLDEIQKRLETDPTLLYVNFLDDTFTLNAERALAISKGLAEFRKTYDFVWFASGHIRTVLNNPGMIRQMQQSGLRKLFFGLESGNDEMLKRYNKHTDRSSILETIAQCMEEGLNQVAGNFILGGPEETPETVEDSFGLIEQLLQIAPGRFDTSFFTFLPYPNTPITSNPDKFGVKIYNEYIDCCLEDIPLSSTEAISYDEMMLLRCTTNFRLQQRMRELYKEGNVPEEATLDTYRMAYRYGIYSKWMEYVYKQYPVDDAYWHMRACLGYQTSSQLTDPQNALVARTLNIWDEYDMFRQTQCNIPISEKERVVLSLANGKLTLRQLEEFCLRHSISPEEVRNILQSFEERKWILYAQI